MDGDLGQAAELASEVLDVGAGTPVNLGRVLASEQGDPASVHFHLRVELSNLNAACPHILENLGQKRLTFDSLRWLDVEQIASGEARATLGNQLTKPAVAIRRHDPRDWSASVGYLNDFPGSGTAQYSQRVMPKLVHSHSRHHAPCSTSETCGACLTTRQLNSNKQTDRRFVIVCQWLGP